MNEWKQDQEAENITLLPDGNGDFAAGMGMLVDKSSLGFGKRSWAIQCWSKTDHRQDVHRAGKRRRSV